MINKEGEGFDYLRQKFPCTSEARINNSIFVGPQVEQLFQDPNFKNKLNAANRIAWDTF
jgi:hypothetical protein